MFSHTHTYMLSPLLLLLFSIPTGCSEIQTRGVPPELLSLYTPSSSKPATWKCLNDSTVIPWTAVNDDYCDCPDGTDEPGTSACPGSTFYCVNQGHMSGRIPSSRVNDGLCEPECCDGSDEAPGVCPNKCKEIGEAHRKQAEAERKIRKTGAKIRSTYLVFAQKEKKRLEDSIVSLRKDVAAQEKEVARLKDVMERTETVSTAALEFKKQSPLYFSLLTHKAALRSLWKAHQEHLEREKQLGDILEALRTGYNPNYQDMAVLEAVKGWEALSGEKSEEESADTEPSDDKKDTEEITWSEDQLKHQLDPLLNQDYVSLLLAHETHLNHEPASLLFDLSSYIPEAFLPQYEWLKTSMVGLLRTVGIIQQAVIGAAQTNEARNAFNEADSKLKSLVNQKKDDEEELIELFDVEGFGRQGEWKKLQDLCLSLEAGEYTYEVCLFGAATQKGNGQHSLGQFSSWNKDRSLKPGEYKFYQIQHYTGGAKCWNGPERSVTLHLSCGTENKVLTVAEPEKCEYHMTATTPALCLPLEDSGKNKEEL